MTDKTQSTVRSLAVAVASPSRQRFMTHNKETRKSRRSVATNGAKLRELRQKAGLTQEELAESIGYSDRLIRKAEIGERVDMKTLRALSQYFSTVGEPVKTADLMVDERAKRDPPLSDGWIQAFFVEHSPSAAARLLSADCQIHLDGVSIAPSDVKRKLELLLSVFLLQEFSIDYRLAADQWQAVGWTSQRECTAAAHDSFVGQNITIRGVTSFRLENGTIVEIQEFTDAALHYPHYHQLLLPDE